MYPKTTHKEQHFTSGDTVRDVIIGMSDGLTVPFALAAGLSGAVGSSFIVLVAGLAEMTAGSIAMGLGGYLAAKSDADTYASELAREQREIKDLPKVERQEVKDIFVTYGLEGQVLEQAVEAITQNPKKWLDFMMRQELGLEPPEPKRARNSAFTIGLSYLAGGSLPLAPYAFGLPVESALIISAILALVALLVFGAFKGKFTGVAPLRSAWQTALVGGLAASAAYLLARLVSGLG